MCAVSLVKIHCGHMETDQETALATGCFYGKSRLCDAERRVKLLRKERDLKQNVLVPQYKLRFDSPSGVWRVFHRQKDALDFANIQSSQDVHVFAYESESFTTCGGQRLFLVCSYEQFWHYYSRLPLKQRHHYEVIAEDAVCKLYFDLEFECKFNDNKNGIRMSTILLTYICAWLFRIYGITCGTEDILLLDASTDQKFSQHAIFNLSKCAFRNNRVVGCFVHHIHTKLLAIINQPSNDVGSSSDCNVVEDIAWLASVGLSRDDLASLSVKHRNGSTTFFYDLGVYSRNRNFRLVGSTKLGKQSGELIVAAENHCYDTSSKTTEEPRSDEEPRSNEIGLPNVRVFWDSLVCNIKFSDKIRILDFDEKPGRSTSHHVTSPACDHHTEGYDCSPFPDVDEFVTSFVQSYGGSSCNGRIWRWAYFSQGVIVYDIIRNRWCANIGRQHRSNNIKIVVDLSRRFCYQKCYDPDCRAANFKSQDYQLPDGVGRKQHNGVNDFEDDDVADVELMQAAICLENSSMDCSTSLGEDLSDDELIQAAIRAETNSV